MTTSTKRALLIGINYLNNPNARLNGCIEDIKNIQNMLIDAYGYANENMVVLRDDIPSKMPTKQNILLSLQLIASAAAPTDEIWIHYSGHGTQLRDQTGDETDGLDEAIVPVDYPTAGMISDDDLFLIVRAIKCRAFLVFDSCHSGSVCDLQYSINYVNGSFAKNISSNKTVINPNIVVLSGSRDAQTSADAYDYVKNVFGGALTMSLTAALRKNRHSVNLMKLYNDVCYDLLKNKYEQIPVLSSSTSNPVWNFERPMLVKTIPAPAVTSMVNKVTTKIVEVDLPEPIVKPSSGYSAPHSLVFNSNAVRSAIRAKPRMNLFI
jgi:hypothetical protein